MKPKPQRVLEAGLPKKRSLPPKALDPGGESRIGAQRIVDSSRDRVTVVGLRGAAGGSSSVSRRLWGSKP